MLAFIGEPFDDACLQFHQNRRYARTASYAQVTERSVRPLALSLSQLSQQLEPVMPILQPVIERLGLRGGLMETPAPRARAPGTVALPIGEVLRIANEYERGGRLADAQRLLNHILGVEPQQGDALHLGGIVAFRQGDIATALDFMERSLRHGIDTPLYLRNICEVYRSLGRLDDALSAAQRATALAPADPLCLHNQAVIHYHRLELQAALDCAGQALRIDPSLPGAHFIRAEALLLRGEWVEGWEEYEWRFRIPSAAPLMPPTTKPQWDGTRLTDGTLSLIADQGFGDIIQFARYIPWAAERCSHIAIAGNGEVASLLRQIAPGARQFLRWEDAPDYTAFCPLSGLPRLAGTRTDNVPAPVPYLHADPARVAQWAERLEGLVPRGFRRVGVIWAGRPTTTTTATDQLCSPTFDHSVMSPASRCSRCKKDQRPSRPVPGMAARQ